MNQIWGSVYFITDVLDAGPVKIGFTSGSVKDRLAALQTGSPVPLKVAASLMAPDYAERRIHRALAEYRLHGEWFERRQVVDEFIASALDDPWETTSFLADEENGFGTDAAIWRPDDVIGCPATEAIWVFLYVNRAKAAMAAWLPNCVPRESANG